MRLVFGLSCTNILYHLKYTNELTKYSIVWKCPLVGLEIQPLLEKLMYVKQKVSVCNTLLHELSCLTPLQTYS